MKRLIHTFTVLFLLSGTASLLQAQAPSAIPYQAVARNSSGNLMVNQTISVRFSIREASVSGTIVYQETHGVTTNALGLFVVNIGQGIPVSGTFSTINWASGAKFTQVEIDATGGTSYTDMGTQQMLSVPYALYASSGGTPPAAGTGISVTGTTITNTAPDQTVTLTGSGATTVTGTYPNFTVSSTDANTTYSGGTGINVTGTMITNTAPDQTVTLTGSGATTVTGTYPNFTVSSTDANTTYSGGTGINVVGTTINNTAPDQTMTLTGAGITTIGGTYPNFSVTSTETDPQVNSTTTNQIPKWNGTTLTDGIITDNGSQVGIGITNPDYRFTLKGTGNEVYSVWSEDGTQTANNFNWQIAPGNGTPTSRSGYFFGNFGESSGFMIGNAANAPLRFGVGTGSPERMRIAANGNIGIGTTAPAEKLDVNGTTRTIGLQIPTGAANGYILQSDASGNASWVNVGTLAVAETDPQVSASTANRVPKWNGSALIDGSIYDNGSWAAIGTTSPGFGNDFNFSKFTIASESSSLSDFNLMLASNDVFSPYFNSGKARGNLATPAIVQNGDELARFSASGYDGTQFKRAASIDVAVDEAPAANSVPGRIVFNTAGAGNASTTERMRITNSGNIGIGITAPADKLDVGGNIRINSNNIYFKINNDLNHGIGYFSDNAPNGTFDGIDLDGPAIWGYGGGASGTSLHGVKTWALRWAGSGAVYMNGQVGIGTDSPVKQLSNTSTNINGSDGNGGSTNSIIWASNGTGYVTGLYNSTTIAGAHGLAVKTAGTSSTNRILDLSTGSTSDVAGTSVMVVRGDGRIGIGTGAPAKQFSNTATNINGSDGNGGSTNSIIWTADGTGYATGLYNSLAATGAHGLAVKTAGTSSTNRILDLSTGSTADVAGTSVMVVRGDGNVGIGTEFPVKQFANTATNISGSDGNGGSTNSIIWTADGTGYATGLYNSMAVTGAHGLAVKTAGTSSTNRILDLSTGSTADVAGTSVMVVRGDGNVGIGTEFPVKQFANTATNISGSDGNGGSTNSIIWASDANGYTMGLYNSATTTFAHGLAVKTAGTSFTNRILDLSTGATANSAGTSVMVVGGDGKVGIGNDSPSYQLHVSSTTSNEVASLESSSTNGTYLYLKNTSGGGNPWHIFSSGSSNDEGAGNLVLGVGATARMVVRGNNGNVGIGNASATQAKLVVSGSQSNNIGGYGFLNDNGNAGTSSGTHNYSIYASDRIAATEFNAFSDLRIKNILGLSDSRADLQTLMNIEITDYKLKDHIAKGSAEYKKVIAQQVEDVYPQAVSKMTDVVPDIYQLAEIHQGYVAVANTLKAGEKVKLIFGERSEVLEVISADANGFNVNLLEEGKVFVYGREVNDFRTVDYEALSTLNISATQELVKMINSLEDKNAEIQQGMAQLKAENQAMKSDIEQIKAALQLNAQVGEVGKRQNANGRGGKGKYANGQ